MKASLEEYRKAIEEALKSEGATDKEMKLLKEETVKNGYERNAKPEDIAWAILQ